MLRKFTKILPYWIIVKLVKRFSPEFLEISQLGKCRAWRVSPGEWVVWSQENYDRMKANEQKYKEWDKADAKEIRLQEYKKLQKEFKEE